MWKLFYDGPIQTATMPWSEYIQRYRSCGSTVQGNFQSNVYSLIGLEMVVISLVFALIYYYYFNYRFGRYYSGKSWGFTLALNSVVVAIATYFTTSAILDDPLCGVTSQTTWITIINFLYAGLMFFIFSIIMKWKSPMAKRTPF